MNVFLREMKANRKSLIIWSICVVLMVLMGMAKYQGYQAAGQSMNDLLADMPQSLKAVLGFGSFDVSKASGFYAVLYLYLQLMMTIHAAMLGAGIISKEERDKTTEFLMVKPVSRTTVITSKLLVAFVNIFVLNIVTLVSSIGIVSGYSKGEDVSVDILKLMAGMFASQLIFMIIGAGIAAITRNSKASTSLSAGILMITFIVAKIADISDKLDGLKYLSPFKYYEAKVLMLGDGFEAAFVILSVVIVAVMSVLTYVFYNKRDLGI